MSPRSWSLGSLLLAALLFAVALQCIPQPRTLTEAPTVTPTIRVVTVTATATPFEFVSPTATVTPLPPLVLTDSLPMSTSTRVPETATPTVPPATMTPARNTTPAVQRG